MNRRWRLWAAGLIVPLMLLGGCPAEFTISLPDGEGGTTDITIPVPGILSRTLTVQVVNDTSYNVVPRIRFHNNTGFWDQLFGSSEELATGELAPGEFLEFPLDCERVAAIWSQDAGQFVDWDPIPIGQAATTRVLEREEDFDCGDTVQFQFIGDGPTFGVVVAVNGLVVD
jgi:hypothetical protein